MLTSGKRSTDLFVSFMCTLLASKLVVLLWYLTDIWVVSRIGFYACWLHLGELFDYTCKSYYTKGIHVLHHTIHVHVYNVHESTSMHIVKTLKMSHTFYSQANMKGSDLSKACQLVAMIRVMKLL